MVHANAEYLEDTYASCQVEWDINAKAERELGTKKSVYEYEENLEDDTLRLIMNPQDNSNLLEENRSPSKSTNLDTDRQQIIDKQYKTLMEKKHPNCLTFDHSGRLFIGDSFGQINVCRIDVNGSDATIVEKFLLKHKEIEGDQINAIIVHPES